MPHFSGICSISTWTFDDLSAQQTQSAPADLILLTAAALFLARGWSAFSDEAQRLVKPGRSGEQSGVDL